MKRNLKRSQSKRRQPGAAVAVREALPEAQGPYKDRKDERRSTDPDEGPGDFDEDEAGDEQQEKEARLC